MTGHLFKSKFDAVQRAKHFHLCLNCRHSQGENWKTLPCPNCDGEGTRQHFGSKIEFHRGLVLLTLLNAGTITNLKFQPRFDLSVNGMKVSTYVADSSYTDEEGTYVVEDVKPSNFMTDTAKLKIKLFQSIFKITVKIPKN